MKKTIGFLLICCLFLVACLSLACAETMLVPVTLEGADTVLQYRCRDLSTFEKDTQTFIPACPLLRRDYGPWEDWSNWGTEFLFPSDRQQVETREGDSGQTEYRSRIRSCTYVYGDWGPWSSWMSDPIEESEGRQVEVRSLSVVSVPGSAVHLTEVESLDMMAGTGTQLFASADGVPICWSSSDSEVAIVNYRGYVSALSAGNAVISAKDELGNPIAAVGIHVLAAAGNLPDDLTVLEEGALQNTAVEALDLRNSNIGVIASGAFSECSQLRFVMTDGMSGTIEDGAFADSPHVNIASASEDAAYQYAEAHGLVHYLYGASQAFIPTESVRIDQEELNLQIGDAVLLRASVSPASATTPYVEWMSMSDAVFVDEYGYVSTYRPGSAVVYAMTKDGQVTAQCNVTVQGIPVSSVTLDRQEISLVEGESAVLSVSTLPENATDPSLYWSSTDPNIVSVFQGVITAHAAGSAEITVKSTDGGEVSATCLVTVTEKAIRDDSLFTEIFVDSITATDATIYVGLNLTENPDVLGFELGTEAGKLQQAAVLDASDAGETVLTEISFNLNQWGWELTEDTEYYYRLYLRYDEAIFVSDVLSFRTEAALPGKGLRARGLNLTRDNSYLNSMILDVSNGKANITVSANLSENCTSMLITMTGEKGYIEKAKYDLPSGTQSITKEFDLRYVGSVGSEISFFVTCYGETYAWDTEVLSFTRPTNTTRLFYTPYNRMMKGTVETFQFECLNGSNIWTFPSKYSSIVSTRSYNSLAAFGMGYAVVTFNSTVNGEALSGDMLIRVDDNPPSLNPSGQGTTVRVFAIGNSQYPAEDETSAKINVFFRRMFGEEGLDDVGNAQAMVCNAENLVNAYLGASYVRSSNVDYSNNPTSKSRLMSKLYNHFAGADGNDLSVIYVGGHGDPSTNGVYTTELANNAGNILLSDYFNIAEAIPGVKVFIIDTCHSGAVSNYFRSLGRNDVCVIAACPADRLITSRPGNRDTYLMHYFLKGIGWKRKDMPADENGDYKVTMAEMMRYLSSTVFQASFDERKHTGQAVTGYAPYGLDPVLFRRDTVGSMR